MAENFPNLMKNMNINIKEAQQTPSKMNSKRPIPRQIRIKFERQRQVAYLERRKKEANHHILVILNKIISRVSSETLEAIKE